MTKPARMGLGLTVFLGGCAWDTPMSTVTGRGDVSSLILHPYRIVTWVSLAIALLVSVVLIIALVRFRDRGGEPGMPPQTHGHTPLEIAWTVAPALVLLLIAIPTVQVIFRTQGTASPQALDVTVVAHQWWWEFRYPTMQVVTANELHLPVGRPVVLHLEGADVIHSFWVPQLAGKRDVIPGRHNTINLVANTPGEYWGQCAEFCGTSHAFMAFRVMVDDPGTFGRWVASQRGPATEVASAAEGKDIFTRSACVGCHTIRGVSEGVIGPDLTHVGSRRMIAAAILDNNLENVARWVHDPGAVKPGVKMPNLGLTPEQARAVATYLESLK